MAEDPEASALTARRAAQHVRLSSADDACEHLCILTIRPSLGPLHLMLADTPWPRGFGATLASVGTFSKGSRTVRYLPALPCRLVRWDPRSDRVPPLQTIIFSSFTARTPDGRQSGSRSVNDHK